MNYQSISSISTNRFFTTVSKFSKKFLNPFPHKPLLALQPNRILIGESSVVRLIVAEEVVMQPRLEVGILVLQAVAG